MDNITWYKKQVNDTEQYTGTGVDIYLMDTGVNTSHPEFDRANVVNLFSHDGTFEDLAEHGTGVASLIVGRNLGMARDATLKVVKMAFNMSHEKGRECFNSILKDKTDNRVAIINCSWTFRQTTAFDEQVQKLQDTNCIIVSAAGNTLSSTEVLFPIGLGTTLGISAVDENNNVISWKENSGPNWGDDVTLFAPGIGIAVAQGNSEYVSAAGTSLATAIVSGILAQYVNKYPDKSAIEIRQLLLDNCVRGEINFDSHRYTESQNLLAIAPA